MVKSRDAWTLFVGSFVVNYSKNKSTPNTEINSGVLHITFYMLRGTFCHAIKKK